MKLRTVVLTLVAALVVGVCAAVAVSSARTKVRQRQIAELEEKEKRAGLTLRERAGLARLRGQPKLFVRLSHGTSMYAGFKDFETAAAAYTVVVARPVASVGRVNEEGVINTSYKFRMLEVLSEPASQKFPFTFGRELPAELQPFGDGEFLVSMRGGTADLEGVEVTTKYDEFEPFSTSTTYLLFLEFDTTKRVGAMTMGPLSALKVNEDSTVETLDKKAHPIKRAVDADFNNSFEQLKSHFEGRGQSSERPARP